MNREPATYEKRTKDEKEVNADDKFVWMKGELIVKPELPAWPTS